MRLFFNLVITTLLLLVLNAFGWLTLTHNGVRVEFSSLTWPIFGTILILAVVLWLAEIVVSFLYVLSIAATLGLMLFALPFLGWAILKGAAHFMPGTLTLHGFWITMLCGWLLLLVKIPSTNESAN